MFGSGNEDRAHDCDGRDGIGERHQGRVKEPRDAPNDIEADKSGEHEDEKGGNEIKGLDAGMRWLCVFSGGSGGDKEAPNSKPQAPEKFQIPNSKDWLFHLLTP